LQRQEPERLAPHSSLHKWPLVRGGAEAPAHAAGSQARWRGRLLVNALCLSLTANAVLAAVVVGQTRTNSSTRLAEPTARQTAVVAANGKTKSTVEHEILASLVRSAKRLPPALIDRGNGLPKNNLEVSCRAGSGRSFACLVRPPRHKPGEGLAVRYRPGRTGGLFTWFPYRSG
jgi:hypothetical protein